MTEANSQNKKQVQRAFNDLRQRIAAKENEILVKCDMALEMTVEEYDRGIKAIVRKMDEIRQSSQNISETLRRDEVQLGLFLAYPIELLCQESPAPRRNRQEGGPGHFCEV